MGITGPKYKYIKIYGNNYSSICYETCSTCRYTGDEYYHHCRSCIEGKLYLEDERNCLDKCPKGYYEENKLCKQCYETCERCSERGDSDNNKCLTCDLSSEYKYSVNVPGLGKNCVSECPNGTKLNKLECIKEEEAFTKSNLMITVGVVGGFILLIIAIIIVIKTFKKLADNPNSIKKSALMNKIIGKTPRIFKETEIETKTPSDLERKEKEKTPKDFNETPGYNLFI